METVELVVSDRVLVYSGQGLMKRKDSLGETDRFAGDVGSHLAEGEHGHVLVAVEPWHHHLFIIGPRHSSEVVIPDKPIHHHHHHHHHHQTGSKSINQSSNNQASSIKNSFKSSESISDSRQLIDLFLPFIGGKRIAKTSNNGSECEEESSTDVSVSDGGGSNTQDINSSELRSITRIVTFGFVRPAYTSSTPLLVPLTATT